MLEIERKKYIFKTKEIWFSDYPFDVKGHHSVVFRSCKNKVDIKGFMCEEFPTFVIDLTQDLDTIWKNMDIKSCRYGIKRAMRDGVRIKLNQNYEDFYEINKSFREKKGLSLSSEKIEIMKKYGTLFVAEFEGEILGGNLYLEDENNMRWLLGASKRLNVEKEKTILIGNANRLIIWQAINYAKEKGIKMFDMGGYYGGGKGAEILDTPNLFKRSFGGKLATHYTYKKNYSKLYRFAKIMYQLFRS
jgi:lipid II:glycine glycyltransferase (peptidoglycan interpeptide bridge formation enzyme)